MKPGDTVRHPTRGLGTISTICLNPVTKRPSKVLVKFLHGEVVCWPDDLVLTRRSEAVIRLPRPALRVVYPAGAA